MMKLNFFLLLLMGAFFAANAQTETLPLDEQGKMIYYEVVTQQHISVDSLKARAFHFFKISGKADDLKLKASSNDSTMVANGKFVINKNHIGDVASIWRNQLSILGRTESGEI
eukprot:Opistho-1_new@22943